MARIARLLAGRSAPRPVDWPRVLSPEGCVVTAERLRVDVVMISQNRAAVKRQVVADLQWRAVQEEDRQNQQLLALSHQILDLTEAVHAYASAAAEGGPAAHQWRLAHHAH